VGKFTISDDPENSRLLLAIDFPDISALPVLIARVRTMFDLDSDPVMVANSLETDVKVKTLLKRFPGVRVPSGWDPFEVGIATILGQLVSVERGRALVGDLIEMLGEDSGRKHEGVVIKMFPPPQKIANAKLEGLKTTGARKRALIEFSRAVAEKKISLESTQDVAEFTKKILELPGIGPWTASYMALKVLRHADAFPETDLILARALEIHPKEKIERMSPWRGYAAALFWRAYAKTLSKSVKIKGKSL
jgi:AraC family transcriptional regulator of adaptative response / DNA-3-methyladenine glycosylase II